MTIALRPAVEKAARERMAEGGKGRKVSLPSQTRDAVAAAVGMSGRTFEKAAEIVRTADADPEMGDLLSPRQVAIRSRVPTEPPGDCPHPRPRWLRPVDDDHLERCCRRCGVVLEGDLPRCRGLVGRGPHRRRCLAAGLRAGLCTTHAPSGAVTSGGSA